MYNDLHHFLGYLFVGRSKRFSNKKIKMKKIMVLLFIGSLLGGCAATNLKTPCPNFGAQCSQKSINTWSK